MYARLGRHERAEAELDRAIGTTPDAPLLWVARSDVYANLGQKEKAAAERRKAAQVAHELLSRELSESDAAATAGNHTDGVTVADLIAKVTGAPADIPKRHAAPEPEPERPAPSRPSPPRTTPPPSASTPPTPPRHSRQRSHASLGKRSGAKSAC